MYNSYVLKFIPWPIAIQLIHPYTFFCRWAWWCNSESHNMMHICSGWTINPLLLSREFSLTFSLYLLRLPHFLASITSIDHIFLLFTGRFHGLLQHWLKSCFSFIRIPLLTISIYSLVLYFKIICFLCNIPSYPLSCTTPILYIHWSCLICSIFH